MPLINDIFLINTPNYEIPFWVYLLKGTDIFLVENS